MRAVIYARYSSDLQSEASIEDQIEICRRYAQSQNWSIVEIYSDAAISGASRFRPGFQKLLGDAGSGRFDIVICEAIDRLGRRLADTADLQDQLSFHKIRLFTPSLGEITQIHVAVMGMMAQMALKDLGEKTKRGLLGRVLKGQSAGGLAYGYRIIQKADGTKDKIIDDAEALIVERIFSEYAAGKSPEAIARDLNKQGIEGPHGRIWSNTTLRGQSKRGTGLLNNELYHGELVWNRCSYVKDPRTGKRVARPNPQEQWERTSVPHLKIIDDDLWERVKTRQRLLSEAFAENQPDPSVNALNATHRPRFVLSGLLRCGCCGGGYTIKSRDRFGCAAVKQKGTCQNSRTITRQELEARVFSGLKDRLMAPELIAEFVRGYQEDVERERKERRKEEAQRTKRLADIDRKIEGILRAIEDGLYEPAMKARLNELKAEQVALSHEASQVDEHVFDILTHPRLAEIYARRIERLMDELNRPDNAEAGELIRSLIEKIELHPRQDSKGLDALLFGDLAGILALCDAAEDNKKRPAAIDAGRRISSCRMSVVAGAGFEPTTFRL